MSKARNYNASKDELPDDDAAAIAELTGALYDGDPVGRRERRAPAIRRNCPPSMLKDRDFAARLDAAVEAHEDEAMLSVKESTRLLTEVKKLLEAGTVKTIDDIPSELIIRGLLRAAGDSRRPTVQLKALQMLAEMQGLGEQKAAGATNELVSDLLDELEARRKGPRRVG